MKTKMILLMTTILFIFFTGVTGCGKDDKVPEELVGTWKFDGFGNTADNSLVKIDPTNYLESSFKFIFSDNHKFEAYSQRPIFFSKFWISKNKFFIEGDYWHRDYPIDEKAQLFENATAHIITKGASFEINGSLLKLFYSESEFLQFYRIN